MIIKWAGIAILACIHVYRTSEAATIQEARSYFKDVLFIVKYNFPAPLQTVWAHFSLWEFIFSNFYIFIPWDSSMQYNVDDFYHKLQETSATKHVTVLFNTDSDQCISSEGVPVFNKYGCIAYNSSIYAMKEFPNYAGYLFAHDDIAMDITNLMGYDKSKLWIGPSNYQTISQESWDDPEKATWWFKKYYGIRAIKQLYESNENIQQTMESCVGRNLTFYASPKSDIFYIPQQLRSMFLDIASQFAESSLFLEIAMPTFGFCFVRNESRSILPYCNPNRTWNVSQISNYCANTTVVHPIKLMHSAEHEFYVRQKMNLQALPK